MKAADMEFLTVAEVATMLKVRERFVYDRIECRDPADRIPAVKIGRRKVRILRADLDAYIAARRCGA